MAIGTALQVGASGTSHMMAGRVIAGVGNGINTSTAPVWQGETSKASWRGRLIVIEMILNIFGFMLSVFEPFFCPWQALISRDRQLGYVWIFFHWRIGCMACSSRHPVHIHLHTLCNDPLVAGESTVCISWPLSDSQLEQQGTDKHRWLIAKGRVEEAVPILAALEAKEAHDPCIITQTKEIQSAVRYERENNIRWKDLLRGRTGTEGSTSTLRRLILGVGTQAMQQLSGVNVTSYYLPLVLIQSIGLSVELSRLLAACNSVSYFLFSLIGIPNVEKWGRRKMMMCESLPFSTKTIPDIHRLRRRPRSLVHGHHHLHPLQRSPFSWL